MRVLLVGEAPARGTKRPFEGRSGIKLRELLGANFERLRLRNLYRNPKPKDRQGSVWHLHAARRRAKRFRLNGDLVLLAGKRVADAFGIRGVRYFEPCLLRGTIAYVVPHPSGVNRWWNVETNRYRARRFFAALFLALDGVDLPDGSLDAIEFRVRAGAEAERAGRVY